MPSLLASSGQKNKERMICPNKVFLHAHMSVTPQVTGREYAADTLTILLHAGEKGTKTEAVEISSWLL